MRTVVDILQTVFFKTFCPTKLIDLYSIITEFCSQWTYWQLISIGSGNAFVPNRCHAITWTNNCPDVWRMNSTMKGINWHETWWRHQMETFTALLAICAGNSPITGEFPTQRPATRSLDFSLIYAWTKGWVSNREAGGLGRYLVSYDVTVMMYLEINPNFHFSIATHHPSPPLSHPSTSKC